MRACLSGHRELALKLYNRNPKALAIVNNNGENCLTIAKSSGHPDIATVLECLEAARLLESKNNSYLSITPQDIEEEEVKFVKPFEILSAKKIRTKSLDEYRLSPTISGSGSTSGGGGSGGRCRMKLRSCSPFCTSSGSSSPVQQPLTISIETSAAAAAPPHSQKPTLLYTSRKQLFKRASFDLSLTSKTSRDLLKPSR